MSIEDREHGKGRGVDFVYTQFRFRFVVYGWNHGWLDGDPVRDERPTHSSINMPCLTSVAECFQGVVCLFIQGW